MIISHQHRYVFVEMPRTGSRAVANELEAYYDGHERCTPRLRGERVVERRDLHEVRACGGDEVDGEFGCHSAYLASEGVRKLPRPCGGSLWCGG
jgi:hypothetical protein